MAALGRHRSFRPRLCWKRCCGTLRGPVRWRRSIRCGAPARRWRAAVSTTNSPAVSPATASTRSGWCRTSRRCSTTTRCYCACTRTGPGAQMTRWLAVSLQRRRHSSSVIWATAGCSPHRWTLTPPDRRAPPTCGRPGSCAMCSVMATDVGPQLFSVLPTPERSSTEAPYCNCQPIVIRCRIRPTVSRGCVRCCWRCG